jgi:hypothetical protein
LPEKARLFAMLSFTSIGEKETMMEFTNGFALTTNDGLHVGFSLGAPSFQADMGECVFMLLPQSAKAIDTPLGIEISELKVRGEQQWEKHEGSIVVFGDNRALLTISSSGAVIDANGNTIGKAIALPLHE